MSSTYSPSLRAELIGAGDQSGTWGSTTNNNFQYIFEAAIAGFQTVDIAPTSNNQVLTYTNGPTSTATADQSVYAILKLNASAVSANFNLFAPPSSKTYVVWNNTSYTATFYNSSVIGNTTAAGSGITIPAGAKVMIWSDATNFWANDSAVSNFSVAGALAVSGTLGVTGNTTLGGTLNVTGDANLTTGAISGIMTAPTAAPGTNTTQLATTAFTTNALSSVTGRILQIVNSTTTTSFTTTSGSFQATGHTATITPTSTSSKILVLLTAELAQQSTNLNTHLTVFRGATNLAGSGNAFCDVLSSAGNIYANAAVNYLDSPASTSALTYQAYILVNGGSGTYNAGGTGVTSGVASITLMEIL